MHNVTSVELTRDCEAIQIPIGTPVTLPAGTPVDITQTPRRHLQPSTPKADCTGSQPRTPDALNFCSPTRPERRRAEETVPQTEGPVDEKLVWETLKSCYDPEIPVNIVDLGLVYDLHIEPLPSGNSLVSVKMTLTAPGCGMGATIAATPSKSCLYLPGVEEAVVEIVWDPPWHQSMITEQGRKVLGIE